MVGGYIWMKMIDRGEFKTVPKKEGVYFLWSKDVLLYIGRGLNLKERIRQHLFPPTLWYALVDPDEIDKISFQETKEGRRYEDMEKALLLNLITKNNGMHNWYKSKVLRDSIDIDKAIKGVIDAF